MVEAFIQAWTSAPLRERSHCHSFIIQLCRVIGVPAPDEDQPGNLDYAFDALTRQRIGELARTAAADPDAGELREGLQLACADLAD